MDSSTTALACDRYRQQLVRYESLLGLMDDLRAMDDLQAVATLAAARWKYLANVSVWRLVLAQQDGFMLIDGARGRATLHGQAQIDGWDRHHWDSAHPCVLAPADLSALPALPGPLAGVAVSGVLVMPFMDRQGCIGLLSAGARDTPLTELDQKFIRLFAVRLMDHTALLQLRQRELAGLRSQVAHDALTGALNRAGILEVLDSTLASSRRAGQHLSVLLADVDHFKQINDQHGHPAGDEVLRELTRRFDTLMRAGEHFGRYGGEEFVFVLVACDSGQALQAANRIRAGIAERPFTIDPATGTQLPVTVSLGVASTQLLAQATAAQLIKHADHGLYAAKAAGRNAVRTSTSLST